MKQKAEPVIFEVVDDKQGGRKDRKKSKGWKKREKSVSGWAMFSIIGC